jgi:hypothetical protein
MAKRLHGRLPIPVAVRLNHGVYIVTRGQAIKIPKTVTGFFAAYQAQMYSIFSILCLQDIKSIGENAKTFVGCHNTQDRI